MRDSIFPVLSCCLSVAWHEQGGDHGPEGVLRSRGVFLESKQWCVTSATEQSLKSGEYWLQGCHTSAFPWPRTVYCLSEHSYVYLTWLIRKLWCCQDTELSLLALQESPSNVGDVECEDFLTGHMLLSLTSYSYHFPSLFCCDHTMWVTSAHPYPALPHHGAAQYVCYLW